VDDRSLNGNDKVGRDALNNLREPLIIAFSVFLEIYVIEIYSHEIFKNELIEIPLRKKHQHYGDYYV
jgi:hypothetical protein